MGAAVTEVTHNPKQTGTTVPTRAGVTEVTQKPDGCGYLVSLNPEGGGYRVTRRLPLVTPIPGKLERTDPN